MIAVDSSALIAILEAEPDAAVYGKAIQDTEEPFVSAVTVLETGMVNSGYRTGFRQVNSVK